MRRSSFKVWYESIHQLDLTALSMISIGNKSFMNSKEVVLYSKKRMNVWWKIFPIWDRSVWVIPCFVELERIHYWYRWKVQYCVWLIDWLDRTSFSRTVTNWSIFILLCICRELWEYDWLMMISDRSVESPFRFTSR